MLLVSKQTSLPVDKHTLMHVNCADARGANTHIAHPDNVLSVLGLSPGYIFSQGGVKEGGANGVAVLRVKPEMPEECRRCFWRAGVEFGE